MVDSKIDPDRSFRCLVINRQDGTCKSFNTEDQVDFSSYSSFCLDSLFDILWTYNSETNVVSRFNIISSEAKIPHQMDVENPFITFPSILSPELALPNKTSVSVNRSIAALNLLCCLDTLTTAHQLGKHNMNYICLLIE